MVPSAISGRNTCDTREATAKPIVVPAKPVIAAKGVAFDTKNLIVPAGRPFELTFNNNDAGVPHNVQIDTNDKSSTLFDGAVETGVITTIYNVPALQPGTYYFLCKVHPNMNGTVTAAPESGAPAPGGPPASGGAAASQAP